MSASVYSTMEVATLKPFATTPKEMWRALAGQDTSEMDSTALVIKSVFHFYYLFLKHSRT